MPSAAYSVFRNAILAEQQIVCTYEGRHRELCPHIIGTNKNGEEVVLAWQFAGGSEHHGQQQPGRMAAHDAISRRPVRRVANKAQNIKISVSSTRVSARLDALGQLNETSTSS